MMRVMPWRSTTSVTASRSAMSPRTITTSRSCSAPTIMRRRQGSSPRSYTTGRWPTASSRFTTHAPMHPNAPVTRNAMCLPGVDGSGQPALGGAEAPCGKIPQAWTGIPHSVRPHTHFSLFRYNDGVLERDCASWIRRSPTSRRLMKPLVVIGGPIHPDAIKQLEAETRVVVTDQTTEEGMVEAAREAEGILFRIVPACTRTLMAACSPLKPACPPALPPHPLDLNAPTDLR